MRFKTLPQNVHYYLRAFSRRMTGTNVSGTNLKIMSVDDAIVMGENVPTTVMSTSSTEIHIMRTRYVHLQFTF